VGVGWGTGGRGGRGGVVGRRGGKRPRGWGAMDGRKSTVFFHWKIRIGLEKNTIRRIVVVVVLDFLDGCTLGRGCTGLVGVHEGGCVVFL
jgi:hypothetical protein